MGDRGNDRPSHQVREDRGHRRPGPLPHSRSPEGELSRLGPRIRPRRFARRRRPTPGSILDLKAVAAPSEKDAAQYYPAMYWYALVNVPAKSEFPMEKIKSQGEWLNIIKTGACNSCHGLGTPGMRTISPELGQFQSSTEAWTRRLMSGGAQMFMIRDITRLDTPRAIAMFADWTDRVAAGELPFDKPARPQGIERNVVVTPVGLGRPHHLSARRGLDRPPQPAGQRQRQDLRDGGGQPGRHSGARPGDAHGERAATSGARSEHAVVQGQRDGAVAILGRRSDLGQQDAQPQSDARREGTRVVHAAHPPGGQSRLLQAGILAPVGADRADRSRRPESVDYDPATGKFTLIDTCFATHHLNFASDANQTLWTSAGVGGPGVIGWLNRKMYEETGDEAKSQGWTPFILDTNSNGKRDDYVEPNQPVDPAKDKRIAVNLYAVAVSPCGRRGVGHGAGLSRRHHARRSGRGSDPYRADRNLRAAGAGIRTARRRRRCDGVYWVALASGHVGSFDRRKCKVLNGPTATGKHCPEGWTLHQLPGPQLRT